MTAYFVVGGSPVRVRLTQTFHRNSNNVTLHLYLCLHLHLHLSLIYYFHFHFHFHFHFLLLLFPIVAVLTSPSGPLLTHAIDFGLNACVALLLRLLPFFSVSNLFCIPFLLS